MKQVTTNIRRFKGLKQYSSASLVPHDHALDLLNVLPSSGGVLEKMRLPTKLLESSGTIVGNSGPLKFFDFQQATGVRQVLLQLGTKLGYGTIGTVLASTLIDDTSTNADKFDMVTSNNLAFMGNGSRMLVWSGSRLWNWGIAKPAAAPTGFTYAAGAVTLTTGRRYRVAGKNSVDGHIGTASDASDSTAAQTAKQITIPAITHPDAQVDKLIWYATLDGGDDYFFHTETNNGVGLVDNLTDTQIATAVRRAQLINDPPPNCKYIAEFQGRIYGAGIPGSPQDIVYSGYERILDGRPERSFPPSNRLRLSIGADFIRGFGVLAAGVVAFSKSNEMYMFRGDAEDVTDSAPVTFSALLEKLPYGLGTLSHYAIVSTKHGLPWLGSDYNVHIFDGAAAPREIGDEATPLLRRITPGQEERCQAVYWNFIERDWYVLAVPIDGASSPNRILFFDLNPSAKENLGIFVSDLTCDCIGVIEDAFGRQKLCISWQGKVWEVAVNTANINGVAVQPTPMTTATEYLSTGKLPAFWRSGYIGNDKPGKVKMFRTIKKVSDNAGFTATLRLVDDERTTFKDPELVPNVKLDGKRVAVNKKSRRMSVEVNFPAADATCNLQELETVHIETGDR